MQSSSAPSTLDVSNRLSSLLLGNLALAAAYWGFGAPVMHFFAQYGLFPSPIWLPAGIALAAAIHGGWRFLPGIFLGSLGINHVSLDAPLIEALLISATNALGPWLGAALMGRNVRRQPPFHSLHDVALFALLGVGVHCLVTGAGGALTLHFINRLTWPETFSTWLSWCLSDAGGALFFSPLLLAWLYPAGEPAKDWLKGGALSAVTLALAGIIFFGVENRGGLPFLLVLPLLWVTLRFSLRQAISLLFLVVVIATVSAVIHMGPFNGGGSHPLEATGLMIVSFTFSVLVIGALAAERRRMQEAMLRDSRQQFDAFMDHLPAMAFIKDASSRMLYVNRRYEQILGSGHVGRQTQDMFPASIAQELLAADRKTLAEGPQQVEETIQLPDGVTRVFQSAKFPIEKEGGIRLIGGIAFDITGHKQLEEALRASEAGYRTLIETAPFPVVITRLSDSTVLYINQHAAKQFGVPQEEASGKPAPDYWANPLERSRLLALLSEKGHVTGFEAELRDRHGTPFWVYLSASVTRFENQTAAFVAFNEISERKQMEAALRESETRYRLVAENSYDVIWTMNMEGRFTYVSPSVERLRGYTVEEVMAQTIDQALTPESAAHAKEGMRHLLESGEVMRHGWEMEQPCKDGSTVWTEVIVNVMKDDAGRPAGILGITRDITEKRRAQEILNSRMVALEAAAESIIITSRDGIVEYVNPAFSAITGYPPEEIVGRKPSLLKSGQQDKAFYRKLWETILHGDIWKGEVVNRRKNGTFYTEAMAIAPVKDAQGRIVRFVAIKHDISERKRLEQQLERMAHYDELTGLPNRSLFFDRLRQALAHAQRMQSRFALLFVDLDGFKDINDLHGHEAGDQLLREVARRLTDCVRGSDTVARMGGDEFTVILHSLNQPEYAGQVAEKIRAALSEPYTLPGVECRVGASIGISLFPDDGVEAETLLSRADTAMYAVKRQGKNAWRFFETQVDKERVIH